MSLQLKPIAGTENRVLIERFEAESITPGGIYIPENIQEKPLKGTVIAISDIDSKGNHPVVKEGDTVLYGKFSGTEITFDGKTYLIMRETDIFAVI